MVENKKILVIEDDANILFALQARFSLEGYKVITDQGMESAELLMNDIRTKKPDYVIIDMIMPEIDSTAIVSNIKSDANLNKTCIFAFSDSSEADANKWKELYGSDYYYIEGEFPIDSFVDRILKIIGNREKMTSAR